MRLEVFKVLCPRSKNKLYDAAERGSLHVASVMTPETPGRGPDPRKVRILYELVMFKYAFLGRS